MKAMRNLASQLWVGNRGLFPDWAKEDQPARCQLYALPLSRYVSRIQAAHGAESSASGGLQQKRYGALAV